MKCRQRPEQKGGLEQTVWAIRNQEYQRRRGAEARPFPARFRRKSAVALDRRVDDKDLVVHDSLWITTLRAKANHAPQEGDPPTVRRKDAGLGPVSYTHLTLPTIYSV